jgi:hypothetical protein
MANKKYKTANMTPDQAARQWADYMRMRRRPQKACWSCQNVFPNTLEHFAAGKGGRVGVRCRKCVAANPVPTRVKQNCPCCGAFTRLVRDRHAPAPVMLCSTCLRTANALLAMSTEAYDRLLQYKLWREQAHWRAHVKAAGPVREEGAVGASGLPGTAARGVVSSVEASQENPGT